MILNTEDMSSPAMFGCATEANALDKERKNLQPFLTLRQQNERNLCQNFLLKKLGLTQSKWEK